MKTFDSKLRALIVDDSIVARRLLVSQLNEIGILNVVETVDGADALNKLHELRAQKAPVGLIITDLRMPKMSGSDFLQVVNQDADFKNIPKLISSVETDRGTVLDAVLAGADGYILKPTTTDVLRDKLEKALARRKAA